MFNLHPGGGLAFFANKELAFGLGSKMSIGPRRISEIGESPFLSKEIVLTGVLYASDTV